jgi:hypothetical protein
MRSFHDLLGIRPYYQFMLGWNIICHFPNNPDNVVGFVGKEFGVVELGVMVMAESMLSACWADQA